MWLRAFLIIVALLLGGCASDPASRDGEATGVPFQYPWEVVADKIEALDASNSSEVEWERLAAHSVPIDSLEQFNSIISGFSKRDQNMARRNYLAAHKAIHYSFETNLHAIVFFRETGETISSMRW